jgi:hypothetical protein
MASASNPKTSCNSEVPAQAFDVVGYTLYPYDVAGGVAGSVAAGEPL